MRRNAVTFVVSLFALSSLTGCSLFKKKDKTADAYDPALDQPATGYADPGYNAAPANSGFAGATGGRTHTVQKGDTLYKLARQYYNDQARWKDIYEANRAEMGSPNQIRVGQRLVIP